jgi:hypothetical protein
MTATDTHRPAPTSGSGERRVLFRHGLGVDVVVLPATVASTLPPELDDVLRCGFRPGRAEILEHLDAFTA